MRDDREVSIHSVHRLDPYLLTFSRLVCGLSGRRVTSFAEYNVPLPEAIDDEHLLLDGVGTQPSGASSITAAWIITIKLFAIIESARWVVVPSEHVSLSDLTTVLQLNDKIDEIQESLPAHLQRSSRAPAGTNGARDEIFMLQSDAIMARYMLSPSFRRTLTDELESNGCGFCS